MFPLLVAFKKVESHAAHKQLSSILYIHHSKVSFCTIPTAYNCLYNNCTIPRNSTKSLSHRYHNYRDTFLNEAQSPQANLQHPTAKMQASSPEEAALYYYDGIRPGPSSSPAPAPTSGTSPRASTCR